MNELFTFREAMDNDFERIAEFFQGHNYGLRKVEWLEWKYLKNPMGKGGYF